MTSLPDDILNHVLSFLNHSNLSEVCFRWANLTHLKSLLVRSIPSPHQLLRFQECQTQSLDFQLPFTVLSDELATLLSSVHSLSTLKSLVVREDEAFLHPGVCLAIGGLRCLSHLTSLGLHFRESSVNRGSGVPELLKCAQAPSLRRIALDLRWAGLGDPQIHLIANTLWKCKRLRSISLCLGDDPITPVGLKALVNICQIPYLQEFCLDLSRAENLGDSEMSVLTHLATELC